MENKTTVPRWVAFSTNPNDPQVKQRRAEALAKARSAALVKDRIGHLCELARGRKVLDIGCVSHFAEAAEQPNWLHGHLTKVAGSCLGVDILEEAIEKLKAKGYTVRNVDLSAEPLDEKFDVIICGELIEHIETAGPLFQNVAAMLAPGGVFALTSPFPWYFGWMAKNLLNGREPVGSVDHVAWYDPCTLAELSERHGLRLRFFAGIQDVETSTSYKIIKSCLRVFTHLGLRPEVLTRSLLYEFERAADQ